MKTMLEIFLDNVPGIDVKISKDALSGKYHVALHETYEELGDKILSRSDKVLVLAQKKAFYALLNSKEEGVEDDRKKYIQNKLKEAAEFHECLILVGPCR